MVRQLVPSRPQTGSIWKTWVPQKPSSGAKHCWPTGSLQLNNAHCLAPDDKDFLEKKKTQLTITQRAFKNTMC